MENKLDVCYWYGQKFGREIYGRETYLWNLIFFLLCYENAVSYGFHAFEVDCHFVSGEATYDEFHVGDGET